MSETPRTDTVAESIRKDGIDWHHSATHMTEFAKTLEIELKQLDSAKRAIHAAHGLLAPLGNQVTPSVMAIREALSILRGAI